MNDMTNPFVLPFDALDRTQVTVVGGKGAHLGELSRIEGIRVPDGFCVTTAAFERSIAGVAELGATLDRLALLDPEDNDSIRTVSAEARRIIEGLAVPADVVAVIRAALEGLGSDAAFAVRSSATAEDLPTASFAGQHDTFLSVGHDAVVDHVRRCWASLFNERAVTYRLRNAVDRRSVRMAVVVQQMVEPDLAGVLFTADPATSNRNVASIEATFGLGEALVAGRVSADVYTVRDGHVVASTIADKRIAIVPSPEGGTREVLVEPSRRSRPALTDAQAVRLAELGGRIERHFGSPQDIEWCIANGELFVVQSRPITTLFPIPSVGEGGNRVFVSVGHGQMMTDPMKPLGLSVFQLTAARPMYVAGGRLFVDVTRELASPTLRRRMLGVFARSDPITTDALRTILERGFVPVVEGEHVAIPPGGPPAPAEPDPALVTELMERGEASLAALERDIAGLAGTALLDFIVSDIDELKRVVFDPQSHQLVMAAIEATWWLNDHLEEWLGERDLADALARSLPHDVTAEMGLALLDVADAIRPHAEVVAFLRSATDDRFMDELPRLPGGDDALGAIRSFLDRYGMRCIGEIDITRPRWSEHPAALLPVILGNVDRFQPGEAARRVELGSREAADAQRDMLARVRELPDGARKAAETKRMIDRVRALMGYREYPKFVIIRRFFVYKQALLAEASRLVDAGVLRDADDISFLTFDELREVIASGSVDEVLIRRRRDELRWYASLTPPRVITSEGEIVRGSYGRRDLPDGALPGLAVSAGSVEGRARVIRDMGDADVEPGDILVTAHTDPSWSPLFVAVAGLVTEVGGLMTHGAVIAREYGLPAVVGVEHATELIRDGQRIRVDGTAGYVELLPDVA